MIGCLLSTHVWSPHSHIHIHKSNRAGNGRSTLARRLQGQRNVRRSIYCAHSHALLVMFTQSSACSPPQPSRHAACQCSVPISCTRPQGKTISIQASKSACLRHQAVRAPPRLPPHGGIDSKATHLPAVLTWCKRLIAGLWRLVAQR